MKKLLDWLDHRTGIKLLVHEAMYERIPCGARFRYVTGSMLVFAFVVQMITGVILWMAYSPSSQTAWESVYYIQHEMAGGWFLRGVHHFMAQAMVVLLGLHLLQVIIDKAYKAPREVNFWLGLILMQIVLALALTGYLLPWDQKGFWATNVATNLMALVPFGIGEKLQQVVVGGSEYGNHTLTRFFAMHAGVLPLLLLIFLGMHIAVFRRHGITAKLTPGRKDQFFWPNQFLIDGIACLALVIVVVGLAVQFDVAALFSGGVSASTHGADLGAPADPAAPYDARPEWYFLFLFQFLKYFDGSLVFNTELVGAIVIPGIVMTLMFFMPFVGNLKHGHKINVAFILLLLGGAGGLTVLAVVHDRNDEEYQAAVAEADKNAERVHELMQRRVRTESGELSEAMMAPREGAIHLLRNDPLTQGPKLFERHCASCHAYDDPIDQARVTFLQYQEPKVQPLKRGGSPEDRKVVRDEKGEVVYQEIGLTGPNLFGFGTRDWIRGLLDPDKIDARTTLEPISSDNLELADNKDHPGHHRRQILAPYFGNTAHRDGRMVQWVKKHFGDEAWLKEHLSDREAEELIAWQQEYLGADPAARKATIDAVAAALAAQAQLPSANEPSPTDSQQIARGVEFIKSNCATYCHRFGDTGQLGLGPDLTGYASYEWMMGIVSDPTHKRFYRRENDRMPSFAKDLDDPKTHTASIRELSLIVDWLRGDYYRKDDKNPLLPHSEEEALQTVHLARAIDEKLTPPPIGEVVSEQVQQRRRAEALFRQNCSACHSHINEHGIGMASENPSAPNLYRFASRKWLEGFLDPERIDTVEYFGNTRHSTKGYMVDVVEADLSDLDDEGKENLRALIVALSAEANLPYQDDEEQEDTIALGRDVFEIGFENNTCADCHVFGDLDYGSSGPRLTGWGSHQWLVNFISDPSADEFYGDSNDRMPAFAGHSGSAGIMTRAEIELVAKWLRGELE